MRTEHLRDSDTTFKVKRSKVNLQGRGILLRPPAQPVMNVYAFVTYNKDYLLINNGEMSHHLANVNVLLK